MSDFDMSKVDVKLLRIFCAVLHEQSISRAAIRLEVSQPQVSHALDRLRLVFNDPLFIRSGRGIVATERALYLGPEISGVLDHLVSLAEPQALDLSSLALRFSLSANDYERHIIAPEVLCRVMNDTPESSLHLMDTGRNFLDSLRARECDLVVTPQMPPDQLDIHCAPLFEDSAMCFFDESQVHANEVRDNYSGMMHAVVNFGTSRPTLAGIELSELGIENNVRLEAANFASIAVLIRGTRLVATLPSRLKDGLFADFGHAPVPFDFPSVRFHMIWHRSTHHSAAYRWFRDVVKASVS